MADEGKRTEKGSKTALLEVGMARASEFPETKRLL